MAEQNLFIDVTVSLNKALQDLRDLAEVLRDAGAGSKELDGALSGAEKSVKKFSDSTKGASRTSRDSAKAIKGESDALAFMIRMREKGIEATERYNSEVGSQSYVRFDDQINKEISDRQKLSSSLKANILERDQEAKVLGGPEYANASTLFNQEIDERAKVSQALKANILARDADAKAIDRQNASQSQQNDQLITLRYALYDVASSLRTVSMAGAAALTAITLAYSSVESAFTPVERILGLTGERSRALRDELMGLTRTIPQSFSSIAEIAEMGAAMDIAENSLARFSSTVARFAAISDGISVDAAAEGFGRIGQLLGVASSDYEKLGSAILYAGNASVATEKDVLQYTQRIAQGVQLYGASAQAVTAWAATLASLSNGLEASQGAMQRLFARINTSVVEGGERLTNFAKISGQTAEEFAAVWRRSPEEAFNSLIEAMSRLNKEQQEMALKSVGIVNTRDVRTVNNLAGNYDLLSRLQSEVNQKWDEGTYLAESYGYVVDDLASKFQFFQNALMEVGEALGSAIGEDVGLLFDSITKSLRTLSDFLGTDAGQAIASFTLRLGVLITALAGLGAILATGKASMLAWTVASRILTTALTAKTVATRVSTTAIGAEVVATSAATTATGLLAGATRVLGVAMRALPIFAVISLLDQAVQMFTAGAEGANNFKEALSTNGIQGAISSLKEGWDSFVDLDAGDYFRDIVSNLTPFTAMANQIERSKFNGAMEELNNTIADMLRSGNLDGATKLFQTFRHEMNLTEAQAQALVPAFNATAVAIAGVANTAVTIGNFISGLAPGLTTGAESLDKVGSSAGGAARKVRTLLDYASDLSKVMSRAFDIRFGSQLAIDSVTESWRDLGEEIDSYRRKTAELNADKAVKEYFLSVAEFYGDDLRAGVLRSDIADLNSQIADSQAKASTELKGNSKAATTNRKRITDLVSEYEDYITALAASGASQSEIQKAVERSRKEFLAQATALGYSEAQLRPYVKSFNDMATAVSRVPRNITVTANTNPALQALNELRASNSSTGSSFKSLANTAVKEIDRINTATSKMGRAAALSARIAALAVQITAASISGGAAGGAKAGALMAQLATLQAQLRSGSYRGGGYTGTGGVNQIAGAVHGKEYVIPAHGVDQRTRLPRPDYVASLHRGRPARGGNAGEGYRAGGYVSPVSGGMDARSLASAFADELRRTPIIARAVYTDAARAMGQGSRILANQGVGT